MGRWWQWTPTPKWPVSLQCTGPRGRSTSWSHWRQRWRAELHQGRSHRKTGDTGSSGSLRSGSSWMYTTADSTDTPSDKNRGLMSISQGNALSKSTGHAGTCNTPLSMVQINTLTANRIQISRSLHDQWRQRLLLSSQLNKWNKPCT